MDLSLGPKRLGSERGAWGGGGCGWGTPLHLSVAASLRFFLGGEFLLFSGLGGGWGLGGLPALVPSPPRSDSAGEILSGGRVFFGPPSGVRVVPLLAINNQLRTGTDKGNPTV